MILGYMETGSLVLADLKDMQLLNWMLIYLS
jgi:hypothetical protein